MILDSILVVPGSHGRLENISAAGIYLQDEEFWLGNQLVQRKAGEKAGNHMAQWRKAREAHPELFQNLRLWCQPAAMVDTIIWRWQSELEAAEFQQAVNLVDQFSAAWTEDALQTAFLLQRLQTGVASGCTSLTQITDVGLAAQAKAALNRWKENARDRMREKARLEGCQCTYKANAVEILRAACAMHISMVEQNRIENTVLRTGRQAGWFHYRPNPKTGLLDFAGQQDWAKFLVEGSDRVGQNLLEGRNSWVTRGQIVPWTDEELKSEEKSGGILLNIIIIICFD